MAEINANPQGTPNDPVKGTGNDPQGAQQQEPAWLSAVPEEHRAAVRDGYMLKSDYTQKTQALSDREKAWNTEKEQLAARKNELERFYSDQYEPFRQKLEQNWDRIAPLLSGQQQPQQHPAQPQQDNAAQYDPTMLSLMDQSGWDRLGQMYQARYVTPQVQQVQQALAQQFNQELVRREQLYQNYLRIMNDAYARKFQDPTLDIPKFMQQALAVQSGQINPLDVAYNQMTYDDRLKAAEEQAFKRGQEDRDVHYKNQQVTGGAMGSTAIPVFRQKPLTRDQVTEAARQVAIKNNHPW